MVIFQYAGGLYLIELLLSNDRISRKDAVQIMDR